MSDFFNETVQKSLKPRWCYGCSNPIAEGEYYARWAGVFEGVFFSSPICAECIEHFEDCATCKSMTLYVDGWYAGDFGEWRAECKKEKTEKCPECNGTGKSDMFWHGKCEYCEGTGEDYLP